jgi:outer membrane protein
MKPAILLFATLVSIVTAFGQEPTATLTLAQAVDAALSQGADSRILQRNLDVAREQYRLSVSQNSFALSGSLGESGTYGFGDETLLSGSSLASGFNQTPQAGLSLNAPLTSIGVNVSPYVAASPLATEFSNLLSILSPGPPPAAPGPTGNVGISVSQTLWNGYPGGPIRAAVEKSQLALRGRELSVESGKLNVISAVTQAYFVMLGAQRNLIVKKQILEQQNTLLSQISALQRINQATAVDLRGAQINAQSADIDARSAENDLHIARIRLAQLIGWPRDREFSITEEEDPQILAASVGEAVAEAMKRRTEFLQIELNRQSLMIDRAMIEGQRTPTISVNGGVTVIVDWNKLNSAGQGSLGVKLGMPILDAGAADHQLEANRIQNEAYGVQEDQLRASIATDVEEAYELVQISLQRLQVARLMAEKYELTFKLKKTEAQYGAATTQDLLNASVDTANAQSAVVRAQRDAQLAVLQLRNAMGY